MRSGGVSARGTTVTALGVLLLATGLPAHAASGTAYVRVNQIGYPASSAKRAYLMASAAETGATFAVKNSGGTTVLSGPIGANVGSWSSAYPDVYAIDFGSVRTVETYTIQ